MQAGSSAMPSPTSAAFSAIDMSSCRGPEVSAGGAMCAASNQRGHSPGAVMCWMSAPGGVCGPMARPNCFTQEGLA